MQNCRIKNNKFAYNNSIWALMTEYKYNKKHSSKRCSKTVFQREEISTVQAEN